MSKTAKILSTAVAASAVLGTSAVSAAVPNIPDEEGFGGYVAFGVGYLDLESNTISGSDAVDLDNDPIDSLADSPDGRDTEIPVVLGEVTYTFSNRNQIFFGTSVEDAVTLDGGALFGWRKGTDDWGTFQVAGVGSLVALDVYEDPFETDVKRKETERTYSGIRLEWDRIMKSGFGAQLQFREIDIDKERSCQGARDNENPAACFDFAGGPFDTGLLERDADEVSAKFYYTFNIAERHQLRPILAVLDHDADGDANDYDSVRAQLTYAYFGDTITAVANATYGELDYDTNNPLFGRERDSDTYGVDATLFYKLPWGDGRWQAFVNGLYGEVDSDINFYDQQALVVSAGAQYRFGVRPGRARGQ